MLEPGSTDHAPGLGARDDDHRPGPRRDCSQAAQSVPAATGRRLRRCRVDRDVGLGAQGVPDPADPQVPHGLDPLDAADRGGGLVDQIRVDRVHQSGSDLGHRGRRTPRIATVMRRPTTGSAHVQPRARPPTPTSTARLVNPSVRAWRPSATRAADPDPIPGDELVAGEADDPCRGHGPQVRYLLGVEQPGDRLVRGQPAGQGDHGDDEEAGEVLGPAIA